MKPVMSNWLDTGMGVCAPANVAMSMIAMQVMKFLVEVLVCGLMRVFIAVTPVLMKNKFVKFQSMSAWAARQTVMAVCKTLPESTLPLPWVRPISAELQP
jgi:hypothetical protein